MNHKIKKLLYESFDRGLNERERNILNAALAESARLRKEKEDIMQMRNELSSQNGQKFKPFFVDQVMNEIRAWKDQKDSNEYFDYISVLFRPVAIAATILIIALVSLNFIKSDRVSLEGAIAVPEVTITDAYDPIVDLNLE